ncbi:PfkB family carbohydrate kinase [Nonomuraea harbinensis]|uniref:PfkB family carbohydrate kinase n=1 Tax=Nonomuraea harbinensis TaxID=1286938 RepID=A0ABW1BXW3_9ACTN|nr:PfkB family carbohydrate kinase [Nonomuraea harbinensis]
MTDPRRDRDVHRGPPPPGPLVVIGDTLLDVDVDGEAVRLCPDAPVPVVDVTAEHARPGGAGLAALLAARDGADVVLITAIGDDPAGRRLCGLLSAELELVRLPLRGETVRKTRVRAGGQTLLRLDTGDGTAPPFPEAPTTGPAHQDEPQEAPETRDPHSDHFDHHARPADDHTPATDQTPQDTDSRTIAAGEHPQHANVTTSDPQKPEPNPTAANGNARDADVTAAGGNTTTDPHTPEPDPILAKGNARDADVIVTGGNTTADRHTREGGPTATDRSVRDTELTAASGSGSAASPHTPESDPTAAKGNTRDTDVTAAGGSVSGAERHMGELGPDAGVQGVTAGGVDTAVVGGHLAAGDGYARAVEVVAGAGAVLVADYGRGVAAVARELLRGCAAPVVWDPHPRGVRPPGGCALITPSEAEARLLCPGEFPGADRAARAIREELDAGAVVVTRGAGGASLALADGTMLKIPAPVRASGQDPCGAGDRLAGAAALAMRAGAGVAEAVITGVGEASRFVAGGGAAAVRVQEQELGDRPRTAVEVAELVRASGGRLIATGGCFDLLHAGHVSLLRRARALGDALVVCVNSDESVRRLKGPSRPIVDVTDRVEVLRALSCVDAVLVFDEGTPVRAIELLRPDVWVKGGDYEGGTLPESEVLAGIGAETVVLDLLPGRSTTNLIKEIR